LDDSWIIEITSFDQFYQFILARLWATIEIEVEVVLVSLWIRSKTR
jgi:hypothetical protein